MSGRRPAEGGKASTADVRAIRAWLDVHARDLAEAPFTTAFLRTSDIGERLRVLKVRLEQRPSEPLSGFRPGPVPDPHRRRASIVVGYLRGEFSAADLPRIEHPWPWRKVCALAVDADESGEDGWGSYLQEDFARPTLRAAIARGDLDVPRAPDDLVQRVAAFLSELASVMN